MQLIAVTNRLIVSSCYDCQLFLGTARQPVFMGDCRYLKLAPFNTRYERQVIRWDERNVWLRVHLQVPLQVRGIIRPSSFLLL